MASLAEATLRPVVDQEASGNRRVKTNECMKVLAKHRGDAVVVCALGMAANEWWAVTRSEDSFYMHGGIGFAASFGLGLALWFPPTTAWVLNSDGSLWLKSDSLITEAG